MPISATSFFEFLIFFRLFRISIFEIRVSEAENSRSRSCQERSSPAIGFRPNTAGAFTLIELLVVIAITSVLIGLAFPVFQGVQNQAKKVQAKNDLTQIVTAVNAFYAEYGRYPTDAAADPDAIYGPEGGANTNDKLFNELRATGTFSLNTRQIVFMSPPDVKDRNNPRGGIGGNNQYYDPWGTQYNVQMDADYTDQMANPYPDTDGSAGAPQLRQGVTAWSYGKDQTKGTRNASANYRNSDDVISWQ